MDRILIEASSFDNAMKVIKDMEASFPQVSYTNPVKTPEGIYMASVHYSIDRLYLLPKA